MYLGDHPPLNIIYYMYLSQLWNNVAVVPIAQNILTSLLIAYILFSLFQKGMPLYYLLPCYLLIALSIPVGLYTVILWKDVPFALLVVLLGFKLAALHIEKKEKTQNISKKEWISLLCLTMALVGFRHNGVLYLFIVPLIILLFGIIRIRPLMLGIFVSSSILLGSVFIIYSGGSETSSYLAAQTKTYVTQAMNQISFQDLKEKGKKYSAIFDVNQTEMQWDLVHLCMYGRYTYNFLKYLRWNDVYPYLPFPKNPVIKKMRETALAIYWKSYEVPWVYFSWNPLYMLILYPLLPLMFRLLPMTAIFSIYIFIPLAVLVFLNIFNWRYYYFAHLASYFILPMIVTDCYSRKKKIVV
jgi:hypothetical protein